MYGIVAGKITSVNICIFDAPNDLAASISTPLVLCTPSIVDTNIGNTHPMNMMNIAGFDPIPNHNIENGIHAIGGIGLNILTINVDILSNRLDHPSISPSVIPTTAARSRPTNTLYNVAIISVNNLPDTTNFMNALNTSIGPGNIYDGTIINTSQIRYHMIISITGKISKSIIDVLSFMSVIDSSLKYFFRFLILIVLSYFLNNYFVYTVIESCMFTWVYKKYSRIYFITLSKEDIDKCLPIRFV